MKNFLFLSIVLFITACSSHKVNSVGNSVSDVCDCDGKGTVNKGTNTAVVKVFLDNNGMPYIDK